MNTTPTEKKLTILGAFADRRILVMLALGFSAGLPNLLVFDTLSAWLRDSGVSLEVIGFFSLATMAYAAKFLWAPHLIGPAQRTARRWSIGCASRS